MPNSTCGFGPTAGCGRWTGTSRWTRSSRAPGATSVIRTDMGSDRGNCGVLVSGGWNGLLIDRLEVRELKPWTDAERLADQKAAPLASGPAPATDGGAWCQMGLWHEYFGMEPALKDCQGRRTTAIGMSSATSATGTARDWTSPEDVAKYRLVVLADTDLRTLSLQQRAWLKDWVEAGGGLLLTGGPYALGRGWWQESDIARPDPAGDPEIV